MPTATIKDVMDTHLPRARLSQPPDHLDEGRARGELLERAVGLAAAAYLRPSIGQAYAIEHVRI